METTPIPHLGGDYAKDAGQIESSFKMLYDTLEAVTGNLDGKIDSLSSKIEERFEKLDGDISTLNENHYQLREQISDFLRLMATNASEHHTILREMQRKNDQYDARFRKLEPDPGFLVREEPPAPEA